MKPINDCNHDAVADVHTIAEEVATDVIPVLTASATYAAKLGFHPNYPVYPDDGSDRPQQPFSQH